MAQKNWDRSAAISGLQSELMAIKPVDDFEPTSFLS